MGGSRRAGPVRSAYTTDQFNDRVKGTGVPTRTGHTLKSQSYRFSYDRLDSLFGLAPSFLPCFENLLCRVFLHSVRSSRLKKISQQLFNECCCIILWIHVSTRDRQNFATFLLLRFPDWRPSSGRSWLQNNVLSRFTAAYRQMGQ